MKSRRPGRVKRPHKPRKPRKPAGKQKQQAQAQGLEELLFRCLNAARADIARQLKADSMGKQCQFDIPRSVKSSLNRLAALHQPFRTQLGSVKNLAGLRSLLSAYGFIIQQQSDFETFKITAVASAAATMIDKTAAAIANPRDCVTPEFLANQVGQDTLYAIFDYALKNPVPSKDVLEAAMLKYSENEQHLDRAITYAEALVGIRRPSNWHTPPTMQPEEEATFRLRLATLYFEKDRKQDVFRQLRIVGENLPAKVVDSYLTCFSLVGPKKNYPQLIQLLKLVAPKITPGQQQDLYDHVLLDLKVAITFMVEPEPAEAQALAEQAYAQANREYDLSSFGKFSQIPENTTNLLGPEALIWILTLGGQIERAREVYTKHLAADFKIEQTYRAYIRACLLQAEGKTKKAKMLCGIVPKVPTLAASSPVLMKKVKAILAWQPPAKVSPWESFQTVNKQAYDLLASRVATSKLDLVADHDAILQQCQNYIRLITSSRDRGERGSGYEVLPSPADPLTPFLLMTKHLDRRAGRTILTEQDAPQALITKLDFGKEPASKYFSSVAVKLDQKTTLVVYITHNRELLIPGVTAQTELTDYLKRTCLESLARATVSLAGEVFKRAGFPQPAGTATTSGQASVIPPDLERARVLPAVAVLDGPPTLASLGQSIKIMASPLRKLTAKRIIDLPLYTRVGKVYHQVPDNQGNRVILATNSPENLYVRTDNMADYSYRLRLGERLMDDGNLHILPYECDQNILAMAEQISLASDLATRFYFYTMIEYPRSAKGNRQFIYQPHKSVKASDPLFTSLNNSAPVYSTLALGSLPVYVHNTVPHQVAQILLASDQAKNALQAWRSWNVGTEDPPEFEYLSEAKRQALSGKTVIKRSMRILPTFRGFNQGRYVPLIRYLQSHPLPIS